MKSNSPGDARVLCFKIKASFNTEQSWYSWALEKWRNSTSAALDTNIKALLCSYLIRLIFFCFYYSSTLREEFRLGVLRRIFGRKRDENVEWRRLHNEELHSLYRSPNIVRVIKYRRLRWVGHVARMEEGRSAFKILRKVGVLSKF